MLRSVGLAVMAIRRQVIFCARIVCAAAIFSGVERYGRPPNASPSSGRSDARAGALADDLALELRQRAEDVEGPLAVVPMFSFRDGPWATASLRADHLAHATPHRLRACPEDRGTLVAPRCRLYRSTGDLSARYLITEGVVGVM
jgi:hypothetical protein